VSHKNEYLMVQCAVVSLLCLPACLPMSHRNQSCWKVWKGQVDIRVKKVKDREREGILIYRIVSFSMMVVEREGTYIRRGARYPNQTEVDVNRIRSIKIKMKSLEMRTISEVNKESDSMVRRKGNEDKIREPAEREGRQQAPPVCPPPSLARTSILDEYGVRFSKACKVGLSGSVGVACKAQLSPRRLLRLGMTCKAGLNPPIMIHLAGCIQACPVEDLRLRFDVCWMCD
jgi:hypothetical protein